MEFMVIDSQEIKLKYLHFNEYLQKAVQGPHWHIAIKNNQHLTLLYSSPFEKLKAFS